MAHWLVMVIALTCLGSHLVVPAPMMHQTKVLRELMDELNITLKAPKCNGSMVWSVNLTGNVYCAAMDALSNVSNCSTIRNTKRILSSACTQHKPPASVSSLQIRDTKIELIPFLKNLLEHLRSIYRHERHN